MVVCHSDNSEELCDKWS